MDDATNLIGNREFLVDCARFAEGLLSETQIKRKYRHFDSETWERLGSDEALVEAIELEKLQRIRSGQCAAERAQVLVATAPQRLGKILNSGEANPRHVIESARELRNMAAGSETTAAAATADKFLIVINLGDEVIRYPASDDKTNTLSNMSSKTIEHTHNVDADDTDTVPSELLAMVAANKQGGDGNGGQPL
jgi:hypothetical protein